MKISRFDLPGTNGGVKIGFVDLKDNQMLEAATVLGRMGIRDRLERAVDIVAYNVEKSGALSQGIGDLSSYDAPRWPLDDVRLLAPIESGSLKDFIAFEQHISTVRKNRGAEVPPEWYEMPVYYKGNHRSLMGHEAQLTWPRYSNQMDYELELACIIGKEGIDITEEDAPSYIGGYTIMNDWSARDIQFQEMAVGLGPSKGKDFATSVGPWLVTPDEFNPQDARMTARINGELWSDGNIGQIHWSFPKMIVHTSLDERVYPGDILGSGTVGGGCGVELGRWLQSGDMVELEVEGIGVLRNRVVRRE